MKLENRVKLAAVVLLVAGLAVPVQADSLIMASEKIFDELPLDAFDRNLKRVRTLTPGGVWIETDDAVIESENSVDDDFGIWNKKDVSYKHDLSWTGLDPDNYVYARLKITAWGADGNNDVIFADSYDLGSLIADGKLLEGFSTTVRSTTNQSVIDVLLGDNMLWVEIDKNHGTGWRDLAHYDPVSVFKSELIVKAIPTPAAFGGGLAALALFAAMPGRRFQTRRG